MEMSGEIIVVAQRLSALAKPLPDQSSDRPIRGQPRVRREISGPSGVSSARSGGGEGRLRSPPPGNGALKKLIPGMDKLDAKLEQNEVALAKNEYLDWLRRNPPKVSR